MLLDYFLRSLFIASSIAAASVMLGIFLGATKAIIRKRRKP